MNHERGSFSSSGQSRESAYKNGRRWESLNGACRFVHNRTYPQKPLSRLDRPLSMSVPVHLPSIEVLLTPQSYRRSGFWQASMGHQYGSSYQPTFSYFEWMKSCHLAAVCRWPQNSLCALYVSTGLGVLNWPFIRISLFGLYIDFFKPLRWLQMSVYIALAIVTILYTIPRRGSKGGKGMIRSISGLRVIEHVEDKSVCFTRRATKVFKTVGGKLWAKPSAFLLLCCVPLSLHSNVKTFLLWNAMQDTVTHDFKPRMQNIQHVVFAGSHPPSY